MEWMNQIVSVLRNKSGDQNMDDHFYHSIINNKLSNMATSMRVSFVSKEGSLIPANTYNMLLSKSGSGKGRTMGLLEDYFLGGFNSTFINTMAGQKYANINRLAIERSASSGLSDAVELKKLEKRYDELPAYAQFYGDSTEAGLKKMREKLEIAGSGSINIELDEISINLHKLEEFLSASLESYDKGKLGTKLLASDSAGATTTQIPMTFIAAGTEVTLFDGFKNEQTFMSIMQQGFARRCHFTYIDNHEEDLVEMDEFDPQRILELAREETDLKLSEDIYNQFENLSNPENLYSEIVIPDHIWIEIIKYEHQCKLDARDFTEFQSLQKANLVNSGWGMTKLMAIYAFADGKTEVDEDHFMYALRYTQESTAHFKRIMDRPSKPQVLAEFIVNSEEPLTLFELAESLPFFKNGTKHNKQEMLDLSQAYSATNNMIIQLKVKENVEYYSGYKLKNTHLDSLILSTSDHITRGYESLIGSWDDLWQVPTSNINYSAHHFAKGYEVDGEILDGYRNLENTVPGSNLLILDVDDGVSIDTAKALLEGQKYLIVTTRSHQIEKNGKVCDRYRIFFPLKTTLTLSTDEYSEFMANVMEDFVVDVDPACKDASRFYYGHEGAEYFYGDGELFDPIEYIPSTKSNENRQNYNRSLSGSTSAIERYLLKKASMGNRNNTIAKYGFVLVDSGLFEEEILTKLINFNEKLDDPIAEREIMNTVMKTVRRRIGKRDG